MSVSAVERCQLSEQCVRQLTGREPWQRARSILGYLAFKDELDLFPALEAAWAAGPTVALPRYVPEQGIYCAAIAPDRGREFVKGAFGVLEPHVNWPLIPLNQLDLVLVPGVAFDGRGRRLGRGKGFYDRLLAEVSGVKCGVALDDQIVESLPAEDHDIAMNFILTPTRWLTVPLFGAAGPQAGT